MNIQCPYCKKNGQIADNYLGRSVQCNNCRNSFTVGQSPPPAAAHPAPPPAPAGKKRTGANPAVEAPAGQPTKIGRYEIRRKLGSGTYGTVYRAFDPLLHRPVALKVPHAHLLADADALTRFRREAEVVAQLRHPLIVPIYDAGLAKPPYYIASAFIEGVTLDKALAESPEDVEQRWAVDTIRKLAEALAFAHERSIVHRDVKPANVIIDAAGNPQLTDFGLAHRSEKAARLTQSGVGLGTPAYMSPEQMRGEAGAAGDQWSLGVMLYEMVVGKRPFDGTVEHVIVQVFQQEPPAPRSVRPEIPAVLEAIIVKCLCKDPAQRYADCTALGADLSRFLAGQATAAGPGEGKPGILRRIFSTIGGWFSGNGGETGSDSAAGDADEGEDDKKPTKKKRKRTPRKKKAAKGE